MDQEIEDILDKSCLILIMTGMVDLPWLVASQLGMQVTPRSALTSGTFCREVFIMKTFLWPFLLFC